MDVKYVNILKPGGYDKMKVCHGTQPTNGPNIKMNRLQAADMVVVKTAFAGINYADICIRWGLYESANKLVGYPICPGFEFSGHILKIGENVKRFKIGDEVFGVSMFGSYSSHVEVPERQIYHIPKNLTLQQAAGFPAVTLTAWMAVDLSRPRKNQTVLIHSAAGGVGSMLVQICKHILGCNVVGVVGSSHKVKYCQELGCDLVIDKSKVDLWKTATQHSPDGYKVVFDANGIETLQKSYNHLAPTGKLVVYGFHTMLPKQEGIDMGVISCWKWLKMGWDMLWTPKFDPFRMVTDNKSVLAFNLSFLFDEVDILLPAFDEILGWVEDEKIKAPSITEFNLEEAMIAHSVLESGKTKGKLVLKTS